MNVVQDGEVKPYEEGLRDASEFIRTRPSVKRAKIGVLATPSTKQGMNSDDIRDADRLQAALLKKIDAKQTHALDRLVRIETRLVKFMDRFGVDAEGNPRT